jgi:type IV pilus assembly protein PilC
VQSLDILRQRVGNPLLKTVLDDVYEKVRAGSSLSEAFESHGTMFPGVYTASLLAGEKSGSLEGVIRRYVAYVKVVSGVKRKTISALVYPAILLVLSCIVVAIIVLRVVPEFGAFYSQFGRDLPLSTRLIVSFSNFAGTYFFLMVAGAVGVVVAFLAWLKRPGNRRQFDKWTLSIPMVGPIGALDRESVHGA